MCDEILEAGDLCLVVDTDGHCFDQGMIVRYTGEYETNDVGTVIFGFKDKLGLRQWLEPFQFDKLVPGVSKMSKFLHCAPKEV